MASKGVAKWLVGTKAQALAAAAGVNEARLIVARHLQSEPLDRELFDLEMLYHKRADELEKARKKFEATDGK